MKRHLVVFFAGALFAMGLAVSGMTQPAKVTGFLDFFGEWDASLGLVMVGAIGVHAVLRRLVARRAAPLFTPKFEARPVAGIDGKLLAGAAIFGLGWGLAGYCPGPSFVAAGGGNLGAIFFVAAMTGGMLLHRVLHQPRSATVPAGCDTGAV